MIIRTLFLLMFSITFVACGGDDEPDFEFDDYREAWVGTYDCTKSTVSFEDNLFTTDIEVIVGLDTTASNLLLFNGQRIPVDEDGQFGLEEFEGSYYDLTLTDDRIMLTINEIFPLGDAIPCYIQGEKR